MSRLTIKARVRADLRSIAIYIARDNPRRAETFVEELISKINAIAQHPLRYRLRSEWMPAVRSAQHRGYHIIFVASDRDVEVVRVIHGSQDIAAILSA